jgi:hypothetical protein
MIKQELQVRKCLGARGDKITKNKEAFMRFLLCLLIDFIGMGTYAAPGIGEFGDLAWAPIQFILVWLITGEKSKLAFWEEILPFTDIIPSATISYFMKKN